MTDRCLLTMMVPDDLVGVATVRADAATFSATWGDRVGGVPAERRVIATALRMLADALDAEAERLTHD